MDSLRLKVELYDSYIIIDRFITIPRGTTFFGLHRIIAAAFGWEEHPSFFACDNILESPNIEVCPLGMNDLVENHLTSAEKEIFYYHNEENVWPCVLTLVGYGAGAGPRAQLTGGLGAAHPDHHPDYYEWNGAIQALDNLMQLEVAPFWQDWQDFIDAGDLSDVELWCDYIEPGEDLDLVFDSQVGLYDGEFEQLAHAVGQIDPFQLDDDSRVPAR